MLVSHWRIRTLLAGLSTISNIIISTLSVLVNNRKHYFAGCIKYYCVFRHCHPQLKGGHVVNEHSHEPQQHADPL